MNHRLQLYRDHGFKHVEGWCDVELFAVFDLLNSVGFNQAGGVAEIGVHHGKFFLLLNALTHPKDRSFAVDVFDRQDLNIDGSGLGSQEIFRRNLESYDAHGGRNTTIISADSTDAAAMAEMVKTVGAGSLRFFSIDGGHTVRHTLSDLQLANELTSNEGVVILDDILNHHWLGVIEGAVKYLQREPTLVPFGIGHNKLLLCKLSFHRRYFEALQQSPLKTKVVSLLGTDLVAL